jgi:hypothetical protein
MEWAFENLRQGDLFDVSDRRFYCNDGKIVNAHSIIVCCNCDYFYDIFNTSKIWKTNIVNSNQMECFLKYIYTRTLKANLDDIIPVWIFSIQTQTLNLKEEFEYIIFEKIKEKLDSFSQIETGTEIKTNYAKDLVNTYGKKTIKVNHILKIGNRLY